MNHAFEFQSNEEDDESCLCEQAEECWALVYLDELYINSIDCKKQNKLLVAYFPIVVLHHIAAFASKEFLIGFVYL